MVDHPYYRIILEELACDVAIENLDQMPYIKSGIKTCCPGDYDIVYDPQHLDQDCLVNCGSFKLYLLFKNTYDRAAWVLRWS
jgi:hypothetical protein